MKKLSDINMTNAMLGACLTLLLIIELLILPVCCLIDADLIEKYFNDKSIKTATVVGCFKKKEQISLAKKLLFKSQHVSVLNINRIEIYENLKTNHQQIGVVLNGDCIESEEFLKTCGRLKLFDVKHHWLITSSSPLIFEKFQEVNLNIDADIHIALKNTSSQNWIITDLYNPASDHGGHLNYTKIGYYNEEQSYNAGISEAKYWTRRNMTGVTLKTIVVFLDPFEGTLDEYLDSDKNRTVNTFNRFQNKLLGFCRDYYNFTMPVELGTSWGYAYPNGSFDGMVGALEQKLIHFGSSPIFVKETRIKVVDYGRNTWIWKAGFLFRSPKARTSIEAFLKPLSASVWLIIGVFAAISIVILKMVTTIERKKNRNRVETSWSLFVIFTLGAFCQQGSPAVPEMTCGRITTITIFLLSVLIYQFYSASIVSNLLMKPTNKIKNLKDLLDSSLKVGCEDIIYNTDIFATTSDETIKQLYYKKVYGKGNTSHFLSTEQGLNFVKDGGYAFHVELARAYPIIEKTFCVQAICELREVKMFRTTDLYNTYQKASPFYNMMETCFQKLAERGILDKEVKHWHARKPECIQSSQSFLTFHVGLDEFYPALLILLIGVVLSLTVLIVEKQCEMFKKKAENSSLKTHKEKLFPFTK